MKVWGYQSIWWHYWWWVSQVAGFLLYVGHFFVISVTSWGYQGVGSIICCWDSHVASCCFAVTILFVHFVSLWELWGIQVEQILPLLHLPMCLFLIMHQPSVLLVYCWMAKILQLGADLFVFILVVRESRAGFCVLRSNPPPLIRSVFNGIWIIAPSWVGFLILWMSVPTTLLCITIQSMVYELPYVRCMPMFVMMLAFVSYIEMSITPLK